MSMKSYTAHKGMFSSVTHSSVIVVDPKEEILNSLPELVTPLPTSQRGLFVGVPVLPTTPKLITLSIERTLNKPRTHSSK